ncbi:hypothetical protein HF251_19670 [Rhizobium leguminosarum]|uniref:Uncharacterized protein n=1 Tax=Rhizobium leguminosarum bv. trifolii (strain WSM1325) TaxID=395491 RepID=C6BAX8_RHILS|nr:hypothetical protein Rleg_6490 [Rhizobium leguminosarum bv. trifolii WSM1325]MBY2932916.1 hypothetical protein [Rhizobium leguminosarum]MBY2964886.1 hypothetical protein [Rhizobium leguminosarum]
MERSTTRFALVLAATLLPVGTAFPQGIPVIDQTAIAKQIESITQLKSQLDTLNQQLQQARQPSAERVLDDDVRACRHGYPRRRHYPPPPGLVPGFFFPEGNSND